MVYLKRQLAAMGVTCEVLNIGSGRRAGAGDAISMRSPWDFVHTVLDSARRGYHVHHFFNVESHRAIILAVVATVLTRVVGGSYSIAFIGGPRQRHLGRRSLWAWINRIPLGAADFLICNNESVKAALTRAGADERKIYPIENFHAAQLADVGDLPQSVTAFLNTHDPVLATVVHPRFETGIPHHEIETLLPALDRLRTTHPSLGCVVVGGSDAVDRYRQLASAAGMSAAMCFAGELAHEQCLAVIRQASVFVRAYLKDGSSSSVREALALGVPTVASENPQHPVDVLQFTPLDAAQLADALRDALSRSGPLRNRLDLQHAVDNDDAHEVELALLLGRSPGADGPASATTITAANAER